MRVISLLCCALIGIGAGLQTSAPGARPTAPVISEVLATQVALDRVGFSPGEIDGRRGKNLERALAAYKQSHEEELSLLGDVPPLVDYAISDADVAGPFTPDIPPNLPDQAALDALNYRNPLEAIAERFHSSPALLQQLNPQATFQKAGEHVMVPNVAAAPLTIPTQDITVVVTKSTSALTIEGAKGQVLFHAPVTSGSTHDPLPIGTWKVNGVQRNPKFHYNPQLFWDATPGDRKATLQSGPNNPVGVVWIDLSKPHYGIHGTPEPSKIGHVESHGCVRLTNWDADRVAGWVKPGTRVVFRE
ncbi:MAG TPA: L,D-transpeptidase [Vicinamibacterales bacterium]|jgi:lipoprotein-anchoring transpeptidase ErfK/SrfK|nr:L,D-transpeptidase [Vicinamibacterales bacterium]